MKEISTSIIKLLLICRAIQCWFSHWFSDSATSDSLAVPFPKRFQRHLDFESDAHFDFWKDYQFVTQPTAKSKISENAHRRSQNNKLEIRSSSSRAEQWRYPERRTASIAMCQHSKSFGMEREKGCGLTYIRSVNGERLRDKKCLAEVDRVVRQALGLNLVYSRQLKHRRHPTDYRGTQGLRPSLRWKK